VVRLLELGIGKIPVTENPPFLMEGNFARELSRHFLIKILLEPRKNIPNVFRPAQVGDGIGDSVVVLEL
jgi:hypothetical protein